MKRTFTTGEGSFGYCYRDRINLLYLRRRPIYITISTSDFLESITDGPLRDITSVTVSTSPLEGSTLLTKLAADASDPDSGFRAWSTGSMVVDLCVEITSKLFPRARKLWVVVK